jgi:hypothetical protein
MNTVRAIGAGLRVVAKAPAQAPSVEPRLHFKVQGRRLLCAACGQDTWDRHSAALPIESLGNAVIALACRQCSRLEFFAREPEAD